MLFRSSWKQCADYFKAHLDNNDVQSAQRAIDPVYKRQPFNFVAIHLEYMLSNQENRQKLACNYWNLFRGQISIPDSDVSLCRKIESSNYKELIDSFK